MESVHPFQSIYGVAGCQNLVKQKADGVEGQHTAVKSCQKVIVSPRKEDNTVKSYRMSLR